MVMREVRDWDGEIAILNATKSGVRRIEMGSPGSAQVTRCRLLREWNNLEATTRGATLILKVVGR
jgi:hypothetical protein